MFRSQKQFRRPIPYRNDDLVANGEWLQWIAHKAGKTKVPDFDGPTRGDENVGGLEVAMQNILIMQVFYAVEQLIQEALDYWKWYGGTQDGGVMMNDLLQERERGANMEGV